MITFALWPATLITTAMSTTPVETDQLSQTLERLGALAGIAIVLGIWLRQTLRDKQELARNQVKIIELATELKDVMKTNNEVLRQSAEALSAAAGVLKSTPRGSEVRNVREVLKEVTDALDQERRREK